MKSRWLVGAMMLVLGCPVGAEVQRDEAAVSRAAQCFIAMASLGQSTDATRRMAGNMGAMFFGGVLFGASPDIDLDARLIREAETLNDTKLLSLLQECGQEMQARGAQISAAGQAMMMKSQQGSAH